jgi:hypothetical protein
MTAFITGSNSGSEIQKFTRNCRARPTLGCLHRLGRLGFSDTYRLKKDQTAVAFLPVLFLMALIYLAQLSSFLLVLIAKWDTLRGLSNLIFAINWDGNNADSRLVYKGIGRAIIRTG